MKRLLITLLLIAISLSTVFGFTACTPETPQETNVVLADFERFEPDFQLTRISRYFGAVRVNTNKDYVKSGKTSAQVLPLGHVPSGSQPWIYWQLSSTRFEYNYSDFSYFKNVSLWIYNAQDETVEIELGFVEKLIEVNDISMIPGEMQRVKPGWNKLVYYPDLDALNLVCDVSEFVGVYLEFPHTPSYDLEDAPVYYVDDVVLKKAPEKQQVKDLIQLDQGEIAYFDKDWQQSMTILNPEGSNPEISIVKASQEGISLMDGRTEESMLKLITNPGGAEDGWPSIEIPSRVIKKCGITGKSRTERDNYRFEFDVYSVDKDLYLYPEFGITGWRSWKAYNHLAKQGQWTTYSIRLSDLPSGTYGDLSGIRVRWKNYFENEQRTFYFDNFRLVYTPDN